MDIRAVLGTLVAVAGVGACSGSAGGPKADAGSDGTGRDASTDGSTACIPFDLATDCPAVPWNGNPGNQAGWCQPTWADALANPICAWVDVPFISEERADCGQYHVREIMGNGIGADYTYDISTGALAAISGCPVGSVTSCGCSAPSNMILPYPGGGDCPAFALWAPACVHNGGDAGPGDAGGCTPGASSAGFSWNAPCTNDAGTDAAPACYASCEVAYEGRFKYVGCVSDSTVGTMCYGSCAECP
jgi:hypothetical protein